MTASYDYVCKALFHGYPYINHIRNDVDLQNLFTYNNGIFLKAIEETFNAGSNNTVAGKAFKLNWGGAPLEYYFINENHVISLRGGVGGDSSGWLEGGYEIKNYLILIKNIQFHYDESEVFRKDFFIYLKDFENLDDRSEYREIPVESYIGRFNGSN